MDSALLPSEIIFLILNWNIRMVSIFEGLNHRLICHGTNEEVLNFLFQEGLMDERCLPGQKVCRTCHTNVRPERSSRAINEVTVHRYIEALLKRNNLPKWDLRYQDLEVIKTAISSLRQNLQPRQTSYTALFTQAVIALLGVRTAWSYLGPHHATCLNESVARHLRSRPPQFWTLVCATFANDQELVRKYLSELESPKTLDGNRYYLDVDFDSFVRDFGLIDSKKVIYIEALAAALTVAIRMGNQDLIRLFLSLEYSKSTSVLVSIGYFNKLSVLNVVCMTTESSNPVVAAVAARTLSRLLLLRDRVSYVNSNIHTFAVRMRAASHIPLSAGVLEDALSLFLHRKPYFYRGVVFIHILCRAALTNDVKLATAMVNLMKGTMMPETPHYFSNPGLDHHALVPASEWADEYGVRQDRLLDCRKPIRIALACSSLEVLEYILTVWPSLRDHMFIQEEADYDRLDSIETHRTCYKPRNVDKHPITRAFDTRACLRAVRDVFLEPEERLQSYQNSSNKAPSIQGLEIVLSHTSAAATSGRCYWGSATVHAAGVDNPAILKTFLNHIDPNQPLPYAVSSDFPNKPFYLADDPARTIGERALRHAYQLGRIENVRLLLAVGVRPASDLRGPTYFEDDIDAAVNALKMRQVLREYGLLDVERTAKVPYLLLSSGGGGCGGVVEEAELNQFEDQEKMVIKMKDVQRDVDMYKWRFGQKVTPRKGHVKFDWPEGKGKIENEEANEAGLHLGSEQEFSLEE